MVDRLLGVTSVASPLPEAAGARGREPNLPSFDATLAHATSHATGTPPSQQMPGSPAAMARPAVGGPDHSIQERALYLLSRRQEILASNIANADTPNYKAVDIDVAEALRLGDSAPSAALRYRIPAQDSLDGNTVEVDTELALYAKNTVRYQFTLDRVSGHYKMYMELFKNLTQ